MTGRTLAILCLVLMCVGCATSRKAFTGREGCVIVDNTEGTGAQSRIFLVSEDSGWRLGMGEVAMGRTLEYCTSRITQAERVYLLIERPATRGRTVGTGGGRRSQTFVLRYDDVWTWDLELNRLSRSIIFRD